MRAIMQESNLCNNDACPCSVSNTRQKPVITSGNLQDAR